MIACVPDHPAVRLARCQATLGLLLAITVPALPSYPAVVPAAPAPPSCHVELPAAGLRPPASVTPSVPTLGTNTLLFLRVRFPEDRDDPISQTHAEQTLREMEAGFQRMSRGRFRLISTVSPVLALTQSKSAYSGPGGFDRFIDDARTAAAAAGIDYLAFDFDVVRHSGVPGFAGGNARLGARGAQVQIDGAGILIHELGHNLGLLHANFWDTAGPGIVFGSPPLPSNFESLPDPRSIPLHPDSVIGHDTVTGPGSSIEYGDPWDIMGSGDRNFSPTYHHYLGWIGSESVVTAPEGRSTYRLFDIEDPDPDLNRLVSIRVPGRIDGPAGERVLAVERPVSRYGVAPEPGVLLRWIDLSGQQQPSLLLDGQPGSAAVNSDAWLPLGRTFSDSTSRIHVTPTASGFDTGQRWIEVVVERGHAAPNAPPVVSLSALATAVGVGEPVTFQASGSDPDDDPLAWSWRIGAELQEASQATLVRSWDRAGDYRVQVEASDTRGGRTAASVLIRVGQPLTRRIHGHVRDEDGHPIAGVRVHQGVSGGPRPLDSLIQTWTDSDGSYVLTGLEPGEYAVEMFHPEYLARRRAPVSVMTGDAVDHDLVAVPIPQVSVMATSPTLAENSGLTNIVRFRRTGPVTEPLTVFFRLGGSASRGSDYASPLIDRVILPAGSDTATLALDLLEDSRHEPDETLRVTVVHPPNTTRFDGQGSPITVFHPGWELLEAPGEMFWSRTHPEYLPAPDSEAVLILLDDDPAALHSVAIHAGDTIAFEEPLVEGMFTLTREGALDSPLEVRLRFSGSATPGLDYDALPEVVTLGSGESTRMLTIRPIADGIEEGEEEIVLEILPDPGYEAGPVSATLRLRDRPVYPQAISVRRRADAQLELTLSGTPAGLLVLEASPDLRHWEPIRTNRLFNTTTATVLLAPNLDQRYFRTVRPE